MPDKNGRARIERTALALFARRGVARTSTRAIARRARLAEGTLYRHYGGKEELAVALFLGAAGRLRDRLEAAAPRPGSGQAGGDRRPAEEIRAIVAAFFGFAADEPEAWRYLMDHPPVRALPRGTRLPKDVVVDAVRRGIDAGAFAALDPVLAAALVVGMIARAVFYLNEGLLKDPPETVRDEVAEAAVRVLEALRRPATEPDTDSTD